MSATQRLQAILNNAGWDLEHPALSDIDRAIADLLIEIAEMVGLRDA